MPVDRVLVLGMSHVTSLANAVAGMTRGPGDASIEVVNLRDDTDIYDRETRTFRTDSLPWRDPDVVCLAIDGNMHNIFSLLQTKQPFRLGDAEQGSVPPQGQEDRLFVPRDMLREEFERRLGFLETDIKTIQSHFPEARFLHVCAPPPVLAMRPMPPPDERPEDFNINLYYLDFAAAPPELRLKIHGLQSEIYAATLARYDVTFLPPPAEACTPDGFLASDYWDNDPTHGNARYGRLVIDQIRAFARARGAA